jgi:hypothetical protein
MRFSPSDPSYLPAMTRLISPDAVRDMRQKIEVLQGQLLLVDTFMKGLDEGYKKFLAAHP